MADIDNLKGGTKRVVEETEPLNNLRGGTKRVVIVGGGGGGSSLPDQDGHSGEFLTTDGTDASWAAVDALPDQTGQSGKFLTTDGTDASWSNSTTESLYFRNGSSNMVGGRVFSLNGQNICIRPVKADGTDNGYGISIGVDTLRAEGATGTYNLGGSNTLWKNVYTKKLNNGADIAVPTTGGTMVVATPPTADGTYVLKATVVDGVVTTAWVAE